MGTRRSTDLLLNVQRDAQDGEGLTRQIYAQLRAAILDGRLRAGDRLPPSRVLAAELGVARLTVATAYDWLRAEGYVFGRVGAGTFVAPVFDTYPTYSVAPVLSEPDTSSLSPPPAVPPSAISPSIPLTSCARRIADIPLPGAGID